MKIFLLSILVGTAFAASGGFVGLLIGGLLARTDWLADPGGGMVILLLMTVLGFIAGLYGFGSTLKRLQKRQMSSN
jgi:hypothetical protein